MNVELLKRIKQHILDEPRRFNMYDWIRSDIPDMRDRIPALETLLGRAARLYSKPEHVPPCRTAACIGGWAVLLGEFNGDVKALNKELSIRDQGYGEYTQRHARQLLDLTDSQVSRLFYTDSWKEGFGDRYDAAMETQDQVKAATIAAEYIDRFIEMDGWSMDDDDDFVYDDNSNIDEYSDPVYDEYDHRDMDEDE